MTGGVLGIMAMGLVVTFSRFALRKRTCRDSLAPDEEGGFSHKADGGSQQLRVTRGALHYGTFQDHTVEDKIATSRQW